MNTKRMKQAVAILMAICIAPAIAQEIVNKGAPQIVKAMDVDDLEVANNPGVEKSYKYLREPNAVVTKDGALVVVATDLLALTLLRPAQLRPRTTEQELSLCFSDLDVVEDALRRGLVDNQPHVDVCSVIGRLGNVKDHCFFSLLFDGLLPDQLQIGRQLLTGVFELRGLVHVAEGKGRYSRDNRNYR